VLERNDHYGTTFYVGAYAAAPSLVDWNPSAEEKFLKSVLAMDGVAGLEVPFTGQLHKYDEEWFLRLLPEDAAFVVTTIPGTAARLQQDPHFGLASTSAAGRNDALKFVRDAFTAVDRMNSQLGRAAVRALEIHSAPLAVEHYSSAAALADSLAEISDWDWHCAGVVLEHCDTPVASRPPAKGFLPLEAEIEAVQLANQRSGRTAKIAVNWGRSVIEQRRPDAAVAHLRVLLDAGLLGGLVLSGCAAVDTRFGPAWADVHVPPAPRITGSAATFGALDPEVLDSASLMTYERIREALETAGTDPATGFRGIKVAAVQNATVEQRIAVIARTLALARHPEHSSN
jgi:hypothetical protein